ncbi:MAG TPA: NAD(P)-dependent oxidoreductase [Gemmatimonadaceae bacterium]|nr:NAD(P)-dependent oxidoreductase [Gemmatimonadaceae bacterium]
MRLLILSQIDRSAVARLAEDHDVVSAIGATEDELRARIADREVLVFRSGVTLSADLLARAPELALIVRGGSGFDNVDLDHVRSRGVEFMRVPEPGARAVAEHAFALMLALARGLLPADRAWRDGRWVKNDVVGYLLRGKTLGIIGAGNIGAQVGELGAAWGMNVIGCVARPGPEVARQLQRRGVRLTDLDDVLRTADFLSIHCSLNPTTRNLIDAAALARMKPGAFLLNLARGGVVDEAALRAAVLDGSHLRGAALDVHAAEGNGHISPLADLPNVILTPHIGSTTVDTQREIGERIVEIVRAFAEQRPAAARHAPAPVAANGSLFPDAPANTAADQALGLLTTRQ